MTHKIIFNGQEYNSPEEMPAEIRQMYEQLIDLFADKNQDGIPDMFQQGMENLVQVNDPVNVSTAQTSQTFVVDGKVYNSLEKLPPNARRQYEAKMAAFDQNRDGVPDVLEGFLKGGSLPSPFTQPGNWETAVSSPPPDIPYTVTTDSANTKFIIAGAIIFILLLIIAVLVAFIMFG